MTFPTTPYIGQKWLDGGRVWQWNGTAWQAANNSVFWEEIAGKPTYMSGSTIVSTSAPSNPIPGLQWWNPTADRLFIWDGAAWVEPNDSFVFGDSDVLAYIANVEAADGQELEGGIINAYAKFIIGCKNDGIWDAIKAGGIFAGARTLEGSLTQLKSTTPVTNQNFTQFDYDRVYGLTGDATSKKIITNRNQTEDPQDNMHIAVYITGGNASYPLASLGTNPSQLIDYRTRNRSSALFTTIYPPPTGYPFFGMERNSPTGYSVRQFEQTFNFTLTSGVPSSSIYTLFGNPSSYTAHRIGFYSIGESLDLAKLEARVNALFQEIDLEI